MNVEGGGPEDAEEAAAMEGASGSDGDASDASGDTCFPDGDASDASGDTSLSDGDPSDASTSSEADYAYYEEDDDPDAGMHNIDEGGFAALLAQLGADFEPAREALDTGSELAAELRALTGGGGGGGGGVDGAHTPPVMASAYAMLARREGNTRAHVRAAPTLAPAETGGAGGEVAPSPASTPPPKRARAGRESGLDFTGSGTGVGGADAGAPPALTADPGSPATPPVGAAARPPPRSMPGGCGLGARTGTFSPAAQRHLAQRFLPTCAAGNLDDRPARAYIARFSRDGSVAVAGFQDSRIRLYDATGAGAGEGVGTSMGGAAVLKDVSARSVQWTVTDVDLTPDGEVLAYSSINPTVRLARVGAAGGVESVANVTDVHENVDLLTERETEAGFHMGVWAVEFSADGKALLAGTSAHAAVVYDMESAQTTAWILGHNDDVNGCCFADQSGHIFFTASDDCTAKVWDTRTPGCQRGRRRQATPCGVFMGHTEGLTHVASRGDGRYLCTNGKDQLLKLWDTRRMTDATTHYFRGFDLGLPRGVRGVTTGFDYRWMPYPLSRLRFHNPHDTSVATFRGHSVLKTLIRCKFSPQHTTGQRYIYTGSNCGRVRIYDILTSECVGTCAGVHQGPVRDVSWHPTEPLMLTAGWDGRVHTWTPPEL